MKSRRLARKSLSIGNKNLRKAVLFVTIISFLYLFVLVNKHGLENSAFYTITTENIEIASNEIDFVYTWVNGSDPAHLSQLKRYSWSYDKQRNRFQDNNELKYSLRSVEKYAPWVRNIYIVTNGQKPGWLNLSHPKIRIITHEQIFPDKSHLPTFNSLAIETHLHRIPGLSQRFLYFNDDFMLGQPVNLEDFYTLQNGFKLRMAWTVPSCSNSCPMAWVNDGQCDATCDNKKCKWDGGDCSRDGKQKAGGDLLLKLSQQIGIVSSFSNDPDLEKAISSRPHKNPHKSIKKFAKYESINEAVFVRLYQNYYDYLTWCVENKLLNKTGFDHKMRILFERVKDQLHGPEKDFTRILKSNSMDKLHLNYLLKVLVKQNGADLFDNAQKMVDNYLDKNNTGKDNEIFENLFRKRKLLDTFSGSLTYTDRLLNEFYGYTEIRKVAAHAPLFVDRYVMEKMQKKFKYEFATTSSNRFRHPTDVQFAFAYSYFIMYETEEFNSSKYFDEIDLNKDQKLDDREIDLVRLKLISVHGDKQKPVSDQFDSFLESCLKNSNKSLAIFDNSTFSQCTRLIEFMKTYLWNGYEKKKAFKYEKINANDVGFVMVGRKDGFSVLGDLLSQPRKFMCLNDDIDYNSKIAVSAYKKRVAKLYDTLFPQPSTFELTTKV